MTHRTRAIAGKNHKGSAEAPRTPPINWGTRAISFTYAITEDQKSELSETLFVTIDSLDAIGVGWDGAAWTFPERALDPESGEWVVVGIARRFPNGDKGFHAGGKRGLIIPADLGTRRTPLLAVEGASDVLAALSRGIDAIGRPSDTGRREQLAEALRALGFDDVIILGENDRKDDGAWPGHDGAVATAQDVAATLGTPVPVAFPPAAHKDLREWLTAEPDLDGAEVLQRLRHTQQLVTASPAVLSAAPVAVVCNWPEVIPLGVGRMATALPEDALPTRLLDLAAAAAESIKVDLSVTATLAIAGLSAAVGNSHCVRVSDSHREPNLSQYLFLAMSPGERKSATFRAVLGEPFDTWCRAAQPDYEIARDIAISDASYWRRVAEQAERDGAKAKNEVDQQRLRDRARQARENIPDAVRRPIVYVDDATSEVTVRLMTEQGGAIAVFSADGRQAADLLCGRYRDDGSTGDTLFLKAHGGDRIDRIRIGSTADGEYLAIDHPSATLALMIQPDKLQEIAGKRQLAESGFLARCAIITPRSLVGSRIETGDESAIPITLRDWWHDLLHSLLNMRYEWVDGPDHAPVELRLSPEAAAIRREFANEIEVRQAPEGDLASLQAHASKAAGEVARLAALYELLDAVTHRDKGRSEISRESWVMAERMHRWRLEETVRSLSLAREGDSIRRARALMEWVAREEGKRRVLSARDIVRSGAAGLKTVEAAETVLMMLQHHGLVRQLSPTGSSTAPRWEFRLSEDVR